MNKLRFRTGGKRLSIGFAAGILCALLLGSVQVYAEDSGDYTYTVRIFAGTQGTISKDQASASKNGVPALGGGDVIVYEGLKKGDSIRYEQKSVTVKNTDKYRANNIRESGKDNYDDEHPQLQSIKVTGDADYVVAYTVRGNEVAYTVNYVDVNGAKMWDSDVFYGNVGDKIIVGAQYVDGYFPNTYNREIEFAAGEGQNEYSFIYQPNPTPTPAPTPAPTQAPASGGGTTTTTTTTTTTGGTAGGAVAAPNAGANTNTANANANGNAGTGNAENANASNGNAENANAANGNTENANTADANAQNGAGTAADENAVTPTATPAPENLPSSPEEVPDLLDINDEEVPLANVSDDDADTDADEDEEDTSGAVDPSAVDAPEGTAHGRISRTMLIGICAAGIAAAVAVIIALLRSRKKGLSDDDDDEDEE